MKFLSILEFSSLKEAGRIRSVGRGRERSD